MLIANNYNPTPAEREADEREETKRLANNERRNRAAWKQREADERFKRAWG